ncbi:ATP-binding protein [Streptomyces lancefieldiae]|uniref:histidine kinase n=1 Tax=Streptomyces lancefieldiae TaxID=3075520 RepID=A0ABU3AU82_9ACTN|nr:ATP-binding protein [Streptomyces sp. DSM 40712]MDT0613748.1 ATP-binding protein [Streptomyces sp. DSM 40712]
MRLSVPRPRSLAGQLFAMQAVLIAVVVAGYALFTYISDRGQAQAAAGRQARSVALAIADSPSVVDAIRTPDPTARLQPYAVRVMRDTDVDFVTIMDPEGIRWTHPDPEQIGLPFRGHIERAQRGETFTETYTGTLGPSVRAVTPVQDGDRVVGLVSAGIKVEEISKRAQEQLTALMAVAAGALLLGAVGTYVINARLRRHTHGMNADELSRMHDYHQAALHAVREGLLMLDGQYRVALINDGGRELLGVTGDVVGTSVADLGLPAQLTGALLASGPRVDEVHLTAERVLVVNTSPVSGGEHRGTVVTLRDVTELQSLMGELNSERGFTQALRSQAHEAANRLHTVVSLIELGRSEEAVEFATAELELAQALTDQVVAAVGEPVLAALLLGKTAQANERGVELVVSQDSRLDDGLLPPSLPARDLVTILGNLVDNAVDAAQGRVPSRVTVAAYTDAAGGGGSGAVAEGSSTRAVTGGSSTRAVAGGGNTRAVTEGSSTRAVTEGSSTRAVTEGSSTRAVTEGSSTRAVAGGGGTRAVAGGGSTRAVAGGGSTRAVAGGGGTRAVAGGGGTRAVAGGGDTGAVAGTGPEVPAGGAGSGVPARRGGSELVLRVSDTGAGVDPDHADLLFQRGFSTKPAGEGGRGLGLALVRQAVQRHGGTLTVAEAEGGGARFEARLPLGVGGDAPSPSNTPADGQASGGAV